MNQEDDDGYEQMFVEIQSEWEVLCAEQAVLQCPTGSMIFHDTLSYSIRYHRMAIQLRNKTSLRRKMLVYRHDYKNIKVARSAVMMQWSTVNLRPST